MKYVPETRVSGYTLVEILLALAVLAVLTQLGVSSFSRLSAELSLVSSVNNLVHVLHLARQASWSAGEDVVLCKSRDQRNCQDDGGWQDGWLLFTNLDQDNPPRADPGEPIHRSGGALPGINISANRRAFVLRPFGLRATNGTLTYCHDREDTKGKTIVVSYTGKARITSAQPNGDPIVCSMP